MLRSWDFPVHGAVFTTCSAESKLAVDGIQKLGRGYLAYTARLILYLCDWEHCGVVCSACVYNFRAGHLEVSCQWKHTLPVASWLWHSNRSATLLCSANNQGSEISYIPQPARLIRCPDPPQAQQFS